MGNKRRILDKSLELFNEKGLASVTVRVICGELNISPGSFSYHFPDKKMVLKTLYKEMLVHKAQVLKDISIHPPTITTYLDAHQNLFLIQESYKFFYLNLFEILTNNPEIKTIYSQNILPM